MKLLFAATVFFSALLLFLIQPMLAKALLPQVGGAANIWVAAMVFFQLALLGGYGYAATGSRHLSSRRQSLLHLGLLLTAALLSIPLQLHRPGLEAQTAPELWIWLTLLITAGLPYFALSASSSLLQRWYHDHYGEEPYILFSASNAGSFAGLFAYPLAMEWLWDLPSQMTVWSLGFAILGALFCLLALKLTVRAPGDDTHAETNAGRGLPLALPEAWRATALAFLPSALFLALTIYLTTDIAPLPMLWVVPLALYLLSFVIVFAPWGASWIRTSQTLHLPAVLCSLATLSVGPQAPAWAVSVHFLFFFIVALSCHGELARNRPEPRKLTAFFFWVSAGGALGGLFNAAMPYLMTYVMEYPALMVISLLALPGKYSFKSGWEKFRQQGARGLTCLLLIILSAAILWLFPSEQAKQSERATIYRARDFFGLKQVMATEEMHLFAHGTTTHGVQSLNPAKRLEPQSYYTPIYALLHKLPERFFAAPFGVLGLGAGTVACYGHKGQPVDFFEIDRQVVEIAKNPAYFTYLRDCPPAGNIAIHLGDGRLELAKMADRRYHLLVLDAFSSDAVPLHLLSREAVAMYIAKSDPQAGLLAFNLSNRYLELRPFMARVAQSLGWKAYSRWFDLPAAQEDGLTFASIWLIMAPPDSPWTGALREAGFAEEIAPLDTPLWTDHYSNILPAIKWELPL